MNGDFLKRIIREELKKIISEQPGAFGDKPVKQNYVDVSRNADANTDVPQQKSVKRTLNKNPEKMVNNPNTGDSIKTSKMPSAPPSNNLPDKRAEKKRMEKLEYQIFNIKVRMNKLGLSILSNRFNQALKDFDLKISKNVKNKEKIHNYVLPVLGNLEALKNALQSLEGEFEKLNDMVEDKNE